MIKPFYPTVTGGPAMNTTMTGGPSSPYKAGRGFSGGGMLGRAAEFAARGIHAGVQGGKVGSRNAANRMTPSIVGSPWGDRQMATGAIQNATENQQTASQATAGRASAAAGPRGGGRKGVDKNTKMKALEGRSIMATSGNPWLGMATSPGAGQSLGPIGDWRQIQSRTIPTGNGLVGQWMDRGLKAAGHGGIEGARVAWDESRQEPDDFDVDYDPFKPQPLIP